MKNYFLLLINVIFAVQIYGQQKSNAQCPDWVSGTMPRQNNFTYYFKTTIGEGNNLTDARYNAIVVLISDLMKTQGVIVSGKEIEKIIATDSNNEYSETTQRNYTYKMKYGEHRIAFEIADEYYQSTDNKYFYYLLFEVAKDPNHVTFERINYSQYYGFSSLWRSTITPGWGQMYKKQTAKGITILCTEICAIAGIIVTQNLSTNYRNKAKNSSEIELLRSYQNKSHTWENARNGCIVAASAIYVYNLIDAIVSKGAKRQIKKHDLAIMPYWNQENQCGLALSLNF